MNDLPPHEPQRWAAITQASLACDHDFGADGQLMNCAHCNLHRDTAHRIGRAHHGFLKSARALVPILPIESTE